MFKKIISFTTSLMAKKVLPWAHEIDAMTDLAAIGHATKQLIADYNKGLFDDHQHLEAFFALDEKTQVIVERITEEYVETDHIDLDYAAHIANVVFLYHRQIYNTYLKLIKNPAELEQKILLTMLLRATNSATAMIKWRYYQFQSAPANIWIQLSKLYSIAEDKFMQNESMQLYLGPESTENEPHVEVKPVMINMTYAYMRACMLGTLETLSFKAPQIMLVCKILDTWSAKLSLDKEYDAQKHLFYVDVTQNAPAKRIRKFKPSKQYRYWALDAINSKIELCLSLLEFNIAPKQAKIIEITQQKHALITLSALRSEWFRLDASCQRRSAERLVTTKEATISYGFDSTCDHIKLEEDLLISRRNAVVQANNSDENAEDIKPITKTKLTYVDLNVDAHSSIVDESNKGIGLQVRKQANELSLGMLVGVAANDKKQEQKVGVIRNIKPVTGNQFHLGVELLSRTAFAAEAENISSQFENTQEANEFSDSISNFSHDFTRFTCLFLPKAFSNTKEDTLIIPRHQYKKNNQYSVNILGKNLLIKPTETLEQHENWVRVAYRSVK
ncbi:MAG TPA: hypothetical protein PL131_02910 [Methylotenera sp.]|nr:hypothetical protein [Methylotenera sp.]